MSDEKSRKWSEGLRFVQRMKNRAYHDGTKLSPYKAMFGSDVKVGLTSSSLPKEVIEGIQTEEELEKIINEEAANEEDIIPSNNTKNDEREDDSENLCSHCNMKSFLSDDGTCLICSRKKQITKNRREAKSNLENQTKK